MARWIKTEAATSTLLKHTGPAAVLKSRKQEDIDRDLAYATPDHVIVNRYMGPVGAPGMPEVGPAGLPRHLLKQGLRDMVRITDARMSGTSYGTVVLHVAPEAAVGGPLAVVQDGDLIELDAMAGNSTCWWTSARFSAAWPSGSRPRPSTRKAIAPCGLTR